MYSEAKKTVLDSFQSIYPPDFDNSTDSKYVKLFPDFDEVFHLASFFCQGIVHPLCSLNLKLLSSELPDQLIHLVHFNDDPYESSRVFNEHCDGYKVTFDLVGNKYVFRGDKAYFNHSHDWEQWVNKTNTDYERVLADYKETNLLLRRYITSDRIDKEEIFTKVGGVATSRLMKMDTYPVNDAGKEFMFIAEYYASHFCEDDGKIYELFFDFESSRVVLRWTYT